MPIATVALFTRAWIEIAHNAQKNNQKKSPSSRGRGLKYYALYSIDMGKKVALFTRAWIEIYK